MTVSVLKLSLHQQDMAYLIGNQNRSNTLVFIDNYIKNPNRSTFTLSTKLGFPNSESRLQERWRKRIRLHPVLSNMLPEGALREHYTQTLKIHSDHEFEMFAHLGQDLPGALVALPVDPDAVPEGVLELGEIPIEMANVKENQTKKFSLAGVQMKFSMREKDGRFNFSQLDQNGELWIVKTPSTRHKFVPQNEYTAMRLAESAGVNIPPIKLVELDRLDGLPEINLPNEQYAFAIKRFDRTENGRVHMEVFAQIFVEYTDQKYDAANHEMIGETLYKYSSDGLVDIQEFARRILVNILLANGDAHLKNWSVLYHDTINLRLSPAYDILSTLVYVKDDKQALNLHSTKQWQGLSLRHFKRWANRVGVPWRAIEFILEETLDKARTNWPELLNELPMNEKHKEQLRAHWKILDSDFKIN